MTSLSLFATPRALVSLWFPLIAIPLPLGAQSVAAGSFAPGGQQLFLLDFSASPLGRPSGLRILQGDLEVVDKDGTRMLRATTRSAFLVQLPSALPSDFTLEFDIVPKMCCNPEDLGFEGTATINQGVASAHVLWHRDHQRIVGGGSYYDQPMPPALTAAVPGMLTNVAVAFQGTTLRMYTNGQLLYTLSREFVRGRVLRVFLGGQNDSDRVVYLARLRIGTGAPITVAAPTTPSVTPPTAAATGPVTTATSTTVVPPTQTGTITPTSGAAAAGATGSPTTVTPPPTRGAAQPTPQPAAQPAANGNILVGTGISDITGPIAEVGMMGYGNGQNHGLHMRLYARAFIFSSQSSGRRVVFVSAELGQLFSSLKQGVLKKLAANYGTLYDDRNVMISATHTHAGPGGYSHHAMYNLTTSGHVLQNYNAIVDGITDAIVQAHNRLAPAALGWLDGLIATRASINRSKQAFDLNPEVLQGTNPMPDDSRMVVLSVRRNSQPAGVIAWFAVHNTSLTQNNYLVSSDHKGYAAYLFEKQYGNIAPLRLTNEFVAAFPNGAEGDQSPNIMPGFKGPGTDEFDSQRIVGELEFNTAHGLFAANQNPVTGDVDFRHSFVLMPGYVVNATTHTNGMGLKTLCEAAYGVSFPAGAEDGPTDLRSSYLVTEGIRLGTGPGEMPEPTLNMVKASLVVTLGAILTPIALIVPPLAPLVAAMMAALSAAMAISTDPCQLPKPVLLPTGRLKWTAEILPFQILRVGQLAIVGIPGEMTVQAGRRLEKDLLTRLTPSGVQRVILTGLANEYSGYITTPEEYNSQQYEGASTLFGRLTFDAYAEIFGHLADALGSGQNPRLGSPPPPDLSLVPQIELQTGVVVDDPFGSAFGAALIQPPATVSTNSLVHVEFRSGHPKNDLKRSDSYVRIERDVPGGQPELVAWDAMPEVKLFWRREGIAASRVTVLWAVPPTATPGTYRIHHSGKYKDAGGSLHDYTGTTIPFVVR